MTAPERIWFAPDAGPVNEHGWYGVQSGKDRLYCEDDRNHHPEDDGVLYVRADLSTFPLGYKAALEAAFTALDKLAEWTEDNEAQVIVHALPIPGSPLAAALALPEVKALVEALEKPMYLLIAARQTGHLNSGWKEPLGKLEAALAALKEQTNG